MSSVGEAQTFEKLIGGESRDDPPVPRQRVPRPYLRAGRVAHREMSPIRDNFREVIGRRTD